MAFQPGDLLFNNVSSNLLCVVIKRASDNSLWDFTAAAWKPAPTKGTPWPAAMVLNMTPDPTFPTVQTATLPSAVMTDPTSCLVECVQAPAGSMPVPTQMYWIARCAGVLMNQARGAILTFTG